VGGGPAYSKRMKMRKKRKVVSNKAGNGDLHHLKLFQIIASPPLTFQKKSSIMYAIASVSIYNSQEKTAYWVFFSRSLFFFFFFFFGGEGRGDLLQCTYARKIIIRGGYFRYW